MGLIYPSWGTVGSGTGGGGVGGVCVITFKNFGPQKVKNPEGELKIEPQDVHVYLHGRDFPS